LLLIATEHMNHLLALENRAKTHVVGPQGLMLYHFWHGGSEGALGQISGVLRLPPTYWTRTAAGVVLGERESQRGGFLGGRAQSIKGKRRGRGSRQPTEAPASTGRRFCRNRSRFRRCDFLEQGLSQPSLHQFGTSFLAAVLSQHLAESGIKFILLATFSTLLKMFPSFGLLVGFAIQKFVDLLGVHARNGGTHAIPILSNTFSPGHALSHALTVF